MNEKWPNSTLHGGRTVAAVFASAIFPLVLLGLAKSLDNPAPIIYTLMFGTLPALFIVCAAFLPYHIYKARRGRPLMWHYARWGGGIGAVLLAFTFLILPSWADEPDLLVVLAVQGGVALAALGVGVCGGFIFHFIAIGRAPPALIDSEIDDKIEYSD